MFLSVAHMLTLLFGYGDWMTSARMRFVQYIKLDFPRAILRVGSTILLCKDSCSAKNKLFYAEIEATVLILFRLFWHLLAWCFSCCPCPQCCVIATISLIDLPSSFVVFASCARHKPYHRSGIVFFRNDFTPKNYAPLVYSSWVTVSLGPICGWFLLLNSIPLPPLFFLWEPPLCFS